jgi:hypothetical protein
MASSPQSPQSDLNEIKKQREIDKLDLEINELSKAGKRFLIGSVGVPLIVAIITLSIFAVSGFFDTHEKLIEIARHDFKEDTIAFAKTKALILGRIEVLKRDSTALRDSIGILRLKVHSYDSLMGFVYKNAQGKDRVILNLIDTISVLRHDFTRVEALRKIT